jgi:hypothetical protein
VAPLFAPYTDGIWLQGSADDRMYGVGAEADDLQPGWAAARTVDQYATRLATAARGG